MNTLMLLRKIKYAPWDQKTIEGRIFRATTLKHSNNNLKRPERQFTESDRSFKKWKINTQN